MIPEEIFQFFSLQRCRKILEGQFAIKCSSLKPQFDYLVSKCKSVKQFKQIHAQITVHEGFIPHETSLPELCRLASFCAISPHGNLSYTKTIFDQQPNLLCNSIIRSLEGSAPPLTSLKNPSSCFVKYYVMV
ncbi:unnamed protein product [Lactuca virosa]|uniref:Uncharacterized protein n=1 Tax=Lactuca virosa TaxID=75947 RepID=A0AAU9LML2_9ASTR|nr:unnamed protein product [Lactuca virosa]